jgi:aspartate-semialdehyde dehydrogenase
MTHNIAVVGATGTIGHEIINILIERNFPIKDFYALASKKQVGREISYGDLTIKTLNVDGFDFSKIDMMFYAGNEIEADEIIAAALKSNVKIIDCIGATLFNDTNDNIVCLPSPIATQIIETLKPLHAHAAIKRIVVSTYQAVSSEGQDGMDELFNQSRKFFVSDELENHVFAKTISFNVIPQIDKFMDDGQTFVEWRLNAEVKKFIDKKIKFTATCVSVPVFIGHAAAITVEFDGDMDAKMAKSLWRSIDDIVMIDTNSDMEFVTPVEISGEDSIYISRLRNDSSVDSGISYWCVADNIRATAAVKAVQAAENIIKTL